MGHPKQFLHRTFAFAPHLVVALCSVVLFGGTLTSAHATAVRIGMILDGPWGHNDEIVGLFEQEITDLLQGEFDARFPPEKKLVGDFTLPTISANLDSLLSDPDIDIVIALGALVSNVAVQKTSLPKPIIAPFVIEAVMPELPTENAGSGVPNLVYVAVPRLTERDMNVFREIVHFDNVAFLFYGAMADVHGDPSERITALSRRTGVEEVTFVPVFHSADEALAQVPASAEAVYLAGLISLSDQEFERLIGGLIERRLPSFSLLGAIDVERGVLAGLATRGLFGQRARRVALIVQRILLGEAPEVIPVAIVAEQRLSINMATARAIGVSPPWEVVTEAELVHEAREDVERRVTLAGVMRESVEANLDLEVQRLGMEAGKQVVREARANLLPHLEANATAAVIDEDRASASMGQVAERTMSGSLALNQLLFGESAWANLSIQSHLQRGRTQELEALRLDIAQDAALAYLNVLSARTLERIQRHNLRVTRENLELARVRAVIGTAGPAEVYRWEAEIAQHRREAIQANSQRNLAEIQLNRLLHRPQEESFLPAETDLEDPELLLSIAPPFRYIGNRANFRLFRAFLVGEALRISPELLRLDAAIDAQERYLKSQGWQYYAPTIALQAQVENIFDRQGAGSDGGFDSNALPPEYAPFASLFPEDADDLNWQIGLNINLPLFKGGSRYATHRRARQESERLHAQRGVAAELIEQRLRSALHVAGASYASIRLTREAAAAAAKTLELVTDAYGRGAVSTLALLDAQNAALTTEEAAAIAVYQFLGDYIRIQRGVGQFDVFASNNEKQELIERLERYIVDNGGSLPPR